MTNRCAFDDIIGQARATGYLRAAVEKDAVSHAYLFVGPLGVGKKTAARALACALVCADQGCGGCAACRRVQRALRQRFQAISPARCDTARDSGGSSTHGPFAACEARAHRPSSPSFSPRSP